MEPDHFSDLSQQRRNAIPPACFAAILLLLLQLPAGCGSRNRGPIDPNMPRRVSAKFLWQNNTLSLSKIRLGMSREDVVATMGRFRVKQHSGYLYNPSKT